MERILIQRAGKNKIFFSTGLWLGAFVCVLGLFIAFPDSIREGVNKGLSLCASAVIPALFPFAVLSSFFVKMEFPKWVARPFSGISRALFGMKGEIFALWITGLVAGFPIGGRTAAGLYRSGLISKREAEVGAAFSNCPSPAFVIAFCGGFFDSPTAGGLLFALLSLSSLVCGTIVCRVFKTDGLPSKEIRCRDTLSPSAVSSFTGACISGWEAINTVCSFVIFFSALLELGERLLGGILSSNTETVLFRGLFELTAGISALGEGAFSVYWRFVFAAFLLSFSGVCANMQVVCFLKEEELDVGPYLVGRCIIVVLCTGLSFFAGLFL